MIKKLLRRNVGKSILLRTSNNDTAQYLTLTSHRYHVIVVNFPHSTRQSITTAVFQNMAKAPILGNLIINLISFCYLKRNESSIKLFKSDFHS